MEGGGRGFLSPHFARSWIHQESGQQLPEVPTAAGRQELGDPKASTLQGSPGLPWSSQLLLRSPCRALGNELSLETVGVASCRPKRLGVQPPNFAEEGKEAQRGEVSCLRAHSEVGTCAQLSSSQRIVSSWSGKGALSLGRAPAPCFAFLFSLESGILEQGRACEGLHCPHLTHGPLRETGLEEVRAECALLSGTMRTELLIDGFWW